MVRDSLTTSTINQDAEINTLIKKKKVKMLKKNQEKGKNLITMQ